MRCSPAVILLAALLSSACSNGAGPHQQPTENVPPDMPAVFSVSPLDASEIVWIESLGNLNPPGHTFPSDHIYFYFTDPDHCPCDLGPRPVRSLADGVVKYIMHGADDAIAIQVTSSVYYYFGHVRVLSSVAQGTHVRAGDLIAHTSGMGFALDLGVVNSKVTASFVSPARYPETSLHGDRPLTFFAEPVRSALYAKVRRTGADKDGRFDFDQTGRLIGNWFLEGLAPNSTASSGPDAWTKHLAFVYSNREPNEPRVSIGGTLRAAGFFAVLDSDPRPETVRPENGPVLYHLHPPGVSYATELLLVQMTGPSTLRAQSFPLGTSAPAFDAGARTYTR